MLFLDILNYFCRSSVCLFDTLDGLHCSADALSDSADGKINSADCFSNTLDGSHCSADASLDSGDEVFNFAVALFHYLDDCNRLSDSFCWVSCQSKHIEC